MCVHIREEVFPFAELDWSQIKDKTGYFNRQTCIAKNKFKTTGYGVRPEKGERSVANAIQSKCYFYFHQEALFGEDKDIGQDDAEGGSPATQATSKRTASQRQPVMVGDSLTGIPVLHRQEGEGEPGESEGDDDLKEYDTPAAPMLAESQLETQPEMLPQVQSEVASMQVEVVPEPETATQVHAQSCQRSESASSGSGQPKKRRKAGKSKLDNLMRVAKESSGAIRAANLEAVQIQANTQRKISQEATYRHETTLDVMNMYGEGGKEMRPCPYLRISQSILAKKQKSASPGIIWKFPTNCKLYLLYPIDLSDV
ncbi:hypothetical protein KEM55_001864 [Ascosphaera atra]|nr:hypothetical protein KEM55_001864 [Ascosphaera atra]